MEEFPLFSSFSVGRWPWRSTIDYIVDYHVYTSIAPLGRVLSSPSFLLFETNRFSLLERDKNNN